MSSSNPTPFECPSCAAEIGEPCRLGRQFGPEYSHETRHRLAIAADWDALRSEMRIETGWTIGRS
jgi:hypothetical protein